MNPSASNLALVWFRQDLRLEDNPALLAALEDGRSVVPVFIWAPEEEGVWALGSASKWWLHQSLTRLEEDIEELGSSLIVRKGPSLRVLETLIKETGAQSVFWNRRYEPAPRERDARIKATLKEQGVHAESFNGNLLFEPWEVRTLADKPFQVFSPFWKACMGKPAPANPMGRPTTLPGPEHFPSGLAIEDLQLLPKIDWAKGLRAAWQPGEAGAKDHLKRFIEEGLQNYAEDRNRPDRIGTSRLSPYLHFGEISPRTIWHEAMGSGLSSDFFLREVGWREFAHHLLFHFPQTTYKPLREDFAAFPWNKDDRLLRAWKKGRTGYPLVDAAMRELWSTGWMHNRARMTAGSFLVKDLLISWQEGARWFWDTLVDADLANNTLGWQWTAGCGADAAPYFRIFNPILQGENRSQGDLRAALDTGDGRPSRQLASQTLARPAPFT